MPCADAPAKHSGSRSTCIASATRRSGRFTTAKKTSVAGLRKKAANWSGLLVGRNARPLGSDSVEMCVNWFTTPRNGERLKYTKMSPGCWRNFQGTSFLRQ